MAVDKDLMTKDEYRAYMKGVRIKRLKIFGVLGAILAVIIIIYTIVGNMKGKQEEDRVKNLLSGIQNDTLELEEDFHISDDDDSDGINNGKETELLTNYQERDTDKDGICDGDEITVGTDPTKSDTDGDGILDGYELIMGLDPTKTKSDGTQDDGQRIFDVEREYNNAKLVVSGSANLSDTVFDNLDLVGFKNNMGIMSDAMSFYTDYTFVTAEISFALNADELSAKNIPPESLSVYKFNADTQDFEKIESKVDTESMTVSADITECATYMLGNTNIIGEPPIMRVQLLIDNSGSMYPAAMCPGSEENDVEFKRLDLSRNVIDMLSEGSLVGISKFTATYTELCDFTSDRNAMSGALDRIRNENEVFNGTNFELAIMNAIGEFGAADGNYSNMIIMLCDGNSDDEYGVDSQKIINAANENNVIVLMIGLGQSVNAQRMQEIAEATGGRYYTAANADALDEVFTQIETTFNYDITAYGDEGKSGYSIANTGFVPAKNGFSFANFRTTSSNGTCFGMAMFARDWYTGSLPLSLDEYRPDTLGKLVYTAMGYDLNGTSVGDAYASSSDLNGITVNAVKNNEFNDITGYLDLDNNSSNMVLTVKSDILQKAAKMGFGAVEYDITELGLDWKYVQLLALDVKNHAKELEEAYGKDETELYKALLRYHVLQWEDVENNTVRLSSDGEACFDRLQELLLDGTPAVVMLNGRHAVNAIAMIQDADCPRRFILQLYDNNYPGEIRELVIEKIVTGTFDENGNNTGIVYSYVAVYDSENVSLTLYDTPTK